MLIKNISKRGGGLNFQDWHDYPVILRFSLKSYIKDLRQGAVLSLCSEIGAGSIVAESALVPQGKIIPPETLVAGVPAKPLRELTDKDRTDWRETKDWYVRMAAQYLDPDNYHPVK